VYWTLECNKLPLWNRTCELITILCNAEILPQKRPCYKAVFSTAEYKILTSFRLISRLGGVVVSMLETGPNFAGSNLTEAIKFRITHSFAWEVKPEVPCCKILRHVKDPLRYYRYWYAKFSLLRPFLLFAPDVSVGGTSRELWWTSQELSPAGIIITMVSLCSHITLGINNRPVGGCSSETKSHPIIYIYESECVCMCLSVCMFKINSLTP
jgi:hypothetical protein